MESYKLAEVEAETGASKSGVQRWIEDAKKGKNDLFLVEVGKNTRIAKTDENRMILKQLAERAKKYRNSRFSREVTPKPEFYDIYDKRQILDIITNLSVNREVPLQYNYMQEMAKMWEARMERFEKETATNSLLGTIQIIKDNLAVIDRYVEGKTKVNIIDLGVGNARPVKELLAHLSDKGILNRYIGIDISPDMLNVAKRNIKKWFNDSITVETHIRDITSDKFDDIIVDDMLNESSDSTINIVLLLGGTFVNFKRSSDALKPIHDSLHKDDLFITSLKIDTEASRNYLDLGATREASTPFSYITDLMNIEPSFYTIERGFDRVDKMRYVRVVLKQATSITFNLGGELRREVHFNKGDSILLYRAWHLSSLQVIDQLTNSGFTLLQSSLTKDRQYFLTIAGVEL